MMRLALVAACLLGATNAFTTPKALPRSAARANTAWKPLSMGYVPDGMTPKQWEAMKKKEAAAKQKKLKFDGTSGMKFRSRSFEEFQKGRESRDPKVREKYKYNMPMEKAAEKLKKGLIKPSDVPYMQVSDPLKAASSRVLPLAHRRTVPLSLPTAPRRHAGRLRPQEGIQVALAAVRHSSRSRSRSVGQWWND